MSEEYGTTAMILAKIGNITPANPGNSPKAAFYAHRTITNLHFFLKVLQL